MLYEHLGATPRVHPDAVVAPTAVISGDVEIGADCQILHGAVITSEGGPIVLGENVIVMENAIVRAAATAPVHIGDHTLIGPGASISGATVGADVGTEVGFGGTDSSTSGVDGSSWLRGANAGSVPRPGVGSNRTHPMPAK